MSRCCKNLTQDLLSSKSQRFSQKWSLGSDTYSTKPAAM